MAVPLVTACYISIPHNNPLHQVSRLPPFCRQGKQGSGRAYKMGTQVPLAVHGGCRAPEGGLSLVSFLSFLLAPLSCLLSATPFRPVSYLPHVTVSPRHNAHGPASLISPDLGQWLPMWLSSPGLGLLQNSWGRAQWPAELPGEVVLAGWLISSLLCSR